MSELEIITAPCCNYCVKPGLNTCHDCQKNPPLFCHTYCQYTYSTPLNKMLHHLKYQFNQANIWALGYLLNSTLSSIKTDTDFIIPMPLSIERYKQRGFNQAEELLKYYQTHAGKIPIKSNIVRKIVDTPSMSSLSRQQRYEIQAIYQVEKNIKGKNILIVDDVITTGKTANNLAKTLITSGARRVEVCTLMRTVNTSLYL